MKSKFLIGLLIAFIGMISLSSCERIDAGHEGIKVSLYGDDKGVGEAALVTGRVWYNPFTTDYIVSHRDSIEKSIEKHLSEALHKENFQLEQLTSGLKYPQTIVDAVNAKNKAVQEAMRVQNEVAVAKAEAEKLIVAAKAEKEANQLREQALTPAILEKMWIEKWNGTVPTVITGGNTSTFLDLSKIRK